jgi:hypothetical protein
MCCVCHVRHRLRSRTVPSTSTPTTLRCGTYVLNIVKGSHQSARAQPPRTLMIAHACGMRYSIAVVAGIAIRARMRLRRRARWR